MTAVLPVSSQIRRRLTWTTFCSVVAKHGVLPSPHEGATRMSSSCVHDCRHPLWGGAGTCHNGIGVTSAICACDAGYASRDAWGNASCVPRVVLVSAYVFLASMSVLAGALVVWDINRHRRLPVRCQISRKIVIRTRALLSSRYMIY